MTKYSTQPMKLLILMDMLRMETDEDHHMSSTEIIRRLEEVGIVCDKRTLARNIEAMKRFGYEIMIESTHHDVNAYYVVDRSFNVPELKILMDAVQAASFITEKRQLNTRCQASVTPILKNYSVSAYMEYPGINRNDVDFIAENSELMIELNTIIIANTDNGIAFIDSICWI